MTRILLLSLVIFLAIQASEYIQLESGTLMRVEDCKATQEVPKHDYIIVGEDD